LISTSTHSYSASPKSDPVNNQDNGSSNGNNGVGQLDQNRGKSDEAHGNGSGPKNQDKPNSPNLDQNVALNLVLNTKPTPAIQVAISKFGNITSVIEKINSVSIKIKNGQIPDLLKLGIVVSYNEDAARAIDPPLENSNIGSTSFSGASGTWNLDMINVTNGDEGNTTRTVSQTGAGSYVAVLDTGLLKNWRAYFNESSIATEYAIAFGGGGGEQGSVSTQPNKWERDQDSHGTHVASTILGFNQPT
jgi:hypothetical protein